jgi:hypothetical protein
MHTCAPTPTESKRDTAEPEGPVLLDSSKTIEHSFMQIKYVPPRPGRGALFHWQLLQWQVKGGHQGDPSLYSPWGAVGIMTGGGGETEGS